MEHSASREQILVRTSWISTIGNGVLSVAKILTGLFVGSLAVLGDGIDSATDVIISVVMIFTARIVSKPPSRKYVFGYEKAESIATKILSLVIFYAGVQMFISSAERLIYSEPRELPGMLALYVTVVSIAGKWLLAWYQIRQGRKINSSMLIANAKNMQNDVLISAGVLAGLFFTFILRLPVLDTVTGLVISAFIIKTSIGIFMDSSIDLMDGVKDESVYEKIFDAVDRVPGAHNAHRVRSRQIGNLYMIDLDIEADGDITLNKAHDIATAVEKSIKDSVENVYDIVVHIEPEGKCHEKEAFGIDKDTLAQ
ncbi:MAG: cation diffusion facilitator family transporter [Tannerellaceae bacterium]|jgi:cation diffusion facilitator family transporter|nr:cation diffusion facilitator family transporter [Tannerellaceae bacterium]